MRDHGGDLDRALVTFGTGDWIDLSTGINRMPYPVPPVSARAWTDLPTKADMAALREVAASYFGTSAPVVPLAGAQAAIQLLPGLRAKGLMRIVSPTYNEYAAVFSEAGWQVETVGDLADLAGADIGIVVNPNNPDGRAWGPEALLGMMDRVGLLIVDESFMDMTPAQSLAPLAGRDGLLVLRSFGKFFGLAGLRLGFALGDPALCARLSQAAGPWPVAGAALEVASAAMQDRAWIEATRTTLATCRRSLEAMVAWRVMGATDLFVLFDVGNASEVQTQLARQKIWTRRFPWSESLLRIGIPAEAELSALKLRLTEV